MPRSAANLTLDALELLDAIDRRGSFAAAAAELGKVPSAVTYAVRKLEDDLDVLLFDRRGYKPKLTEAGVTLLREGRQLLAAANDLARRVQRVATGWEQELSIALDAIVPFVQLQPLLAEFCDIAPTQVRIAHEVLGGTWDALAAGRADLAIGATQSGPASTAIGSGIASFELARVPFVFAVAPKHPLAKAAEPIALAELRRHRQVAVGDTSRNLPPRAAGLTGAPNVLTVPTMEAKLATQLAGIGVGWLPEPMAREAITRKRLVVKTTEHSREDSNLATLHVAWRTDARGKALAWWLKVLRRWPRQ
jgi:DNA-binding transcriptional LysR family regulator